MREFAVRCFAVSRGESPVITDADFVVRPGEVVVLQGKNGAGKSTLLNALMGHPAYTVTAGSVVLDGKDLTALAPHGRAKYGLFLSLQQPPEVTGVPIKDFLRTAIGAMKGERPKQEDFDRALAEACGLLRLDPKFVERSLNEGFSGGEKKKSELLQMLMLAPKYALLDEPDSGLDRDAIGYAGEAIASLRAKGTGFVVVTHYDQFLALLRPDQVLTLESGAVREDV